MPILITTDEAVAITGIPIAKFTVVMRSHGITPIDFGRGRGNGLRWPKEAVIDTVVRGVLGRQREESNGR